jgi:hypothetical protein
MAKAVGVTEKNLLWWNQAIITDEVLPKFAKQLEITYGIENVQRIDNLASAQTRLSNSWTNFVRSLDEDDGNTLSRFFTKTLVLSELVKALLYYLRQKPQNNKKFFLKFKTKRLWWNVKIL